MNNAMGPTGKRGLYAKYTVNRTDGRDGAGEKHEGCRYFVLDLTHDWHARKALIAYMKAVHAENPDLADGIAGLLRTCDFGQ